MGIRRQPSTAAANHRSFGKPARLNLSVATESAASNANSFEQTDPRRMHASGGSATIVALPDNRPRLIDRSVRPGCLGASLRR
jgi:hypothetical protein